VSKANHEATDSPTDPKVYERKAIYCQSSSAIVVCGLSAFQSGMVAPPTRVLSHNEQPNTRMKLFSCLALMTVLTPFCVPLSVSASTRTWDGGALVGSWTLTSNWSNNIPPSPGDALVFPTGANRRTNVNSFPAGTLFSSISVGEDYLITGNPISLSSSLTSGGFLSGSVFEPDITLTTNVTVSAAYLNGLTLGGVIQLNHHLLRSEGAGFLEFKGNIDGIGNVVHDGSGTLQVSGDCDFNGDLRIYNGTLRLDGTLPLATAEIYYGANLVGNGECDVISCQGVLSPGNGGPGRLSARGSVWFDGDAAAGEWAIFHCELNGPQTNWLSTEIYTSGIPS
jgi:autotransporter-associated beta strand protein